MIPIEGHNNLFRDESTGALVNLDTSEYNQYIKIKSDRKKQKEEIENIKKDIEEIKLFLKEIINGSR
jgi:SPX domain protein involved in polyphosphate accumulation